MSEQKQKVLSIIIEWTNDFRFGHNGIWKGLSKLEEETGIGKAKLQKILKELKQEGKIIHSTTYDIDGIPNGSGYFISENNSGGE